MISLGKLNSYILFYTWLCVTVLFLTSINRNIILLLWITLFFIAIVQMKRLNFKIVYKGNITAIWMILLFYTTGITFVNYLFGSNNLRSVYHCIVGFLVPFFSMKLLSKKCNIETIIRLFRGFVLVCSIVGIAEYTLKIQPYSILITDFYAANNFSVYGNIRNSLYPYRTTLIFYHPIFYSVFLSCGLAILIYKPFKSRTCNILSVVLLLCNLILTQSRTGWISACTILFFYLLDVNRSKVTKKKVLSSLKIIGGLLLLVVLVFLIKYEMISKLFTIIIERVVQVQEGEAGKARLANLALISLSIDRRNFVSILMGSGRNYASMLLRNNAQVDGWVNAVDNQYLTFFLDYGIIGLSMLIFFYCRVLYKFWKSNNVNFSLLLCIIISFSINSLFFEFFNMNTIYYFFSICIVFCECTDNIENFG